MLRFKRSLAALAALWAVGAAGAAQAEPFGTKAENTLATALVGSCLPLATTSPRKPSGMYWVKLPNSNRSALFYCKNDDGPDENFNGVRGGWTLVWSNLRGGKGKLTSDMHWGASIETMPRYNGSADPDVTPDLQSFETFTGLRWWKAIGEAGRREMLYEWARDYSDTRILDRRAACPFALNTDTNYTVVFNSAGCKPLIGTDMPGLFGYHNGRQWTTVDRDNDTYGVNCAGLYSGNPWWYGACWSGAIAGGGEDNGGDYKNGAHWTGSANSWGDASGGGAGNGWIYVR